MRRLLLPLFLVLLLTSCGWRLEGTERLPPSLRTIALSIPSPYGTFGRKLRTLLTADGARVYLDHPPAGAARLTIFRLRNDQRVVNVNAQGVPAVYEVRVHVVFELVAGGQALLPVSRIVLSRPYFYQPLAPLAMTEESARIVHHLEREAAGLLVLRLLHLPPSKVTGSRGSPPRGGVRESR